MTQHRSGAYYLPEEELERAMVLMRYGTSELHAVFGLCHVAQDLTAQLCWIERASHSERAAELLEDLEAEGQREADSLIQLLKSAICEEWGYCRRRVTDGLGDPRRLVQELFRLIYNYLCLDEKGVRAVDRSWVLLAAVVLARSDLGKLCRCAG
ncbi:hypothetical protein Mrub_0548 [Meiothermus ruber DSM 1279]|uniref:Uncharacterized protein n=1 Tax=Meiothermus ruber (strain ATCC 35948 / DSM 1279 / VKM B-1258 / 21) TaxID=504728 RepID=D3PND2_MEIRD|nr:hypothetical protein Mrub_0548 [Meiothermus ruber DSM 1279]AGK03777.1 hypothetical protein K649_02365 [Meiothermus ruber DSM 1279]